MPDVVLISAAYDRRPRMDREQPQLGLAYIAAYLRSRNIAVEILDAALDNLSPAQAAQWAAERSPRIAGFTTTSIDRFWTIETIQALRANDPRVFIVGGGPHFMYTAADALECVPELDAVAIGEGELLLAELAEALSADGGRADLSAIAGLAWRPEPSPSPPRINAPRSPIADLNALPDPAWDLFPMERYDGVMSADAPYRAIGLISSRGCPYNCAFCSNSLTRRVRYMAPDKFLNQLAGVSERYAFPGLNFQDDSFTANEKHVRAICEGMLDRKMKLKWYCSLRVSTAARSPELLELMKEAGCIALGFGVEYPDDAVLKAIQKNLTVETMHAAMRNVARVGFPHVKLFLINSLPGQNRLNSLKSRLIYNELLEMLEGRKSYKPKRGSYTFICPGTALERIAREQGNVFPPDFRWNRPYETPYRKQLGLEFSSMPIFENPAFPLDAVQRAHRDLSGYLRWKKIVEQRKWAAAFEAALRPKGWRMLRQAWSVSRDLRRIAPAIREESAEQCPCSPSRKSSALRAGQ